MFFSIDKENKLYNLQVYIAPTYTTSRYKAQAANYKTYRTLSVYTRRAAGSNYTSFAHWQQGGTLIFMFALFFFIIQLNALYASSALD